MVAHVSVGCKACTEMFRTPRRCKAGVNCSNCLTGEPAKVNTGLITHPPDGCDNFSDIASYQQRLAPDMRAAEIGRCMKESVCRDRLPQHKLAARCHQLLPCSQDRQDFVDGCCVPS